MADAAVVWLWENSINKLQQLQFGAKGNVNKLPRYEEILKLMHDINKVTKNAAFVLSLPQ